MNLQNLIDLTKLLHYNANYAIQLLINQIKNLSKLLYRAGLRSSMICTFKRFLLYRIFFKINSSNTLSYLFRAKEERRVLRVLCVCSLGVIQQLRGLNFTQF